MVIRIGCATIFVLVVLILIIFSFLGKGCSAAAEQKYLKLTPTQIQCLENWDKWELRLNMPYRFGAKGQAIGDPKDCSGFEEAKFGE